MKGIEFIIRAWDRSKFQHMVKVKNLMNNIIQVNISTEEGGEETILVLRGAFIKHIMKRTNEEYKF